MVDNLINKIPKNFFNSWMKYFLLVPIIWLLAESMFYRNDIKTIDETLLEEKFVEIKNATDVLAAAVEDTPKMEEVDRERIVISATEYMDNLYQIYGEALKLVDGELVTITYRNFETSVFDPRDYPEFIEDILNNDSGETVIGYTPDNQDFRELHIYFRWMPTFSEKNERYLVLAGVSRYSVVNSIPLRISTRRWISMGVTFVFDATLIMVLGILGHVYSSRKGEDKYRDSSHFDGK